MSDTIRLSAPNFFVLHEHVIGPHAYVGSLATWAWTAPHHHSTHPVYRQAIGERLTALG